jgi:hypothetical protein
MRQPDNLPAFCRVHRNGRPLIGYRPADGSARSSPGSTRRRTATSATRSPPISTAGLRASPKPGCRSCSVRRNAGRTPALWSVGGLRPICARARSLRARFGRSERYRETASGAVAVAGWRRSHPQEPSARAADTRRRLYVGNWQPVKATAQTGACMGSSDTGSDQPAPRIHSLSGMITRISPTLRLESVGLVAGQPVPDRPVRRGVMRLVSQPRAGGIAGLG